MLDFLCEMVDKTLDKTLNSMQFTPSGKLLSNNGCSNALRWSTTSWQIFLDFLSLAAHLGVALKVTHFAARRPVLFALVPHALCHQARDLVKLLLKRATIVCAMEMLRQLLFSKFIVFVGVHQFLNNLFLTRVVF